MKAPNRPISIVSSVVGTLERRGQRSEAALGSSLEPTGAMWSPVPVDPSGPPTADTIRPLATPPLDLPAELEASIIATLSREIDAADGHRLGNDRREQDLVAIFRSLTRMHLLGLRRRLDADRATDPLVVAFRRLAVERRQRLRAFIADPRRHR